jgi:hypothetical protein
VVWGERAAVVGVVRRKKDGRGARRSSSGERRGKRARNADDKLTRALSHMCSAASLTPHCMRTTSLPATSSKPTIESSALTSTTVPPSLRSAHVTVCALPTASTGDGKSSPARTASWTSATLLARTTTAGVVTIEWFQLFKTSGRAGADVAMATTD